MTRSRWPAKPRLAQGRGTFSSLGTPELNATRQTQLKRERSVLILVTPSRPLGLAQGRGGATAPAPDKLLKLCDDVLEPRSSRDALAMRIERSPKFSRAAQSDTQARPLAGPQVLSVMLARLGHGEGLR